MKARSLKIYSWWKTEGIEIDQLFIRFEVYTLSWKLFLLPFIPPTQGPLQRSLPEAWFCVKTASRNACGQPNGIFEIDFGSHLAPDSNVTFAGRACQAQLGRQVALEVLRKSKNCFPNPYIPDSGLQTPPSSRLQTLDSSINTPDSRH